MTKQEFLLLCDQVFKEYGFIKSGKSYYLDLGSDVVGSIHFQLSNYGKTIYLNCGFSLKGYNNCLPYPKYHDTNMDLRISIPGKERLNGKPDSYEYLTDMIKYALYDSDELKKYIENALRTWVIPAIKNGMSYILTHSEYYSIMIEEAKILHRIPV